MAPSKTTLVTDTTAQTGLKCFCVQVVADAVFTTLTGLTGSPAGVTFTAGSLLWGNFSAVTLASGKVLIYEV
jgi:hypothetical protein